MFHCTGLSLTLVKRRQGRRHHFLTNFLESKKRVRLTLDRGCNILLKRKKEKKIARQTATYSHIAEHIDCQNQNTKKVHVEKKGG